MVNVREWDGPAALDTTSYMASLLTPDTIRLGVSVDPDGNNPCSSVVGTLTEVPPT
jgi:hypothetical protein